MTTQAAIPAARNQGAVTGTTIRGELKDAGPKNTQVWDGHDWAMTDLPLGLIAIGRSLTQDGYPNPVTGGQSMFRCDGVMIDPLRSYRVSVRANNVSTEGGALQVIVTALNSDELEQDIMAPYTYETGYNAVQAIHQAMIIAPGDFGPTLRGWDFFAFGGPQDGSGVPVVWTWNNLPTDAGFLAIEDLGILPVPGTAVSS